MNKIAKYSLYSVGSVVALIAGSAFYITATFDANTLKPRLEAWVKAEKQRNLKFNGPINLSLFPKPGLTLTDVDLSERNADALFAHVSDARVSMQLWPLLSKKIIIDEVDVQGATINVVKNKSGQYNFADLTETKKQTETKALPDMLTDSEPSSGTPSSDTSFHLSQFNIAKSSVKYTDQQSGQQMTLKDMSLFGDTITAQSAGHIDFSSRLQSAAPVLDLQINTKLDQVKLDKKTGQLLLDGLYNVLDGKLDKETFKLTLTVPKLNVTANSASAETISLSALLNGATRKMDASFKLEGISGDLQQINARALKLAVNASQADQTIKLTVNSPVNVKLETQAINLAQLAIRGDITSGEMKSVPIDLSGKLNAELKAQHVSTVMKGALEHNPLDFSADVKGFKNPAIRFALKAPTLDLNRYIAKEKPAAASAGNQDNAAKSSGQASKVDLSGLNGLNIDGQINIGQLKYAALDAKAVSLMFNTKNGLLSVPALSLKAFGGDIAASGTATTTSSPRISVKPDIAGVDIYALLKQFAGFEKKEGRATVNGSLAMQGGDTTALKNSLTGNLNTRITDGAWRGINVAKTIREAKAALSGLKGGEQTVAASNVEKTDFTELTASVLFNQGVATNKDLTMKSPLLRISGEGDVNLRTDNINYLLKAALVNTSKGQEGADRDKLHGVTVPIRIKGPTSAPKYSLDLTAALKENAGAKLEEKKQEVQQKLEQKASDALSKGLKKLF